jgi:hypothetical protein
LYVRAVFLCRKRNDEACPVDIGDKAKLAPAPPEKAPRR